MGGADEPRTPTPASHARRLDERDGPRLRTVLAVFGLELDLRALKQRLEALAADRAEVHEHVLAAITRSDEAKALRLVEPLHGSGCHKKHLPSPQSRTGKGGAHCDNRHSLRN